MAEIQAGDRAAEQGVPQRALLAGRQVGQQNGGLARIGPGREVDQPGRVQVAAEQAGQPGDRAARGEQVHLQAPAPGHRQRRDQEPVFWVGDEPVGDTEDDGAGAGDVGHLAGFADAQPERTEH